MHDKQQLLRMLEEEFDRWEALLSRKSEALLTDRQLPAALSVKDVVAHLRAWQQISIARLEAARLDREPEFPGWPAEFDLETEENVDTINAWIHETFRDQPWSSVYRDWKAGFLRFLELAEAIPEADLLEAGRYSWLQGYPLSAVLLGSYEHHHEHLESLLAWFGRSGESVEP